LLKIAIVWKEIPIGKPASYRNISNGTEML